MVLCLPDGGTATDPDPGETAKRDVELATAWDGTPAAVVGVGDGGWTAVELAAANGGLVERLALVATPPLDGAEPRMVGAKTLLLYGSRDGGQKRATWWKSNPLKAARNASRLRRIVSHERPDWNPSRHSFS